MTWTRVQHFSQTAQYTSTSAASTSVTLGSAVAVGDAILAGTQTGEGASSPVGSTLTDQLGNTYTRLTAGQGGSLWSSTNHQAADLWWCIVTHAGTPTITYTPTPGTNQSFQSIIGDHFTGSDAASTRRASAGQEQGGASVPGTGTDAITSTSVAASNGDLLYGATTEVAIGSGTLAGGTGFTASAVTASQITEWKTATGAASATFTDATNGASDDTMTIAIAITSAATGGGQAPTDYDAYLPVAAPAPGPLVTTY